MSLQLTPLTQRAAKEWISEHHRHSGVPRGDVFRVGVSVDGQLVGVGMAGRPVARLLDDGHTLEVTRVCTNGTANACSKLYGHLNRAAKALGYHSTITYTTEDEDAASVKAAGYVFEAWVNAEASWSRPSRQREEIKRPTCRKARWRRYLAGPCPRCGGLRQERTEDQCFGVEWRPCPLCTTDRYPSVNADDRDER